MTIWLWTAQAEAKPVVAHVITPGVNWAESVTLLQQTWWGWPALAMKWSVQGFEEWEHEETANLTFCLSWDPEAKWQQA